MFIHFECPLISVGPSEVQRGRWCPCDAPVSSVVHAQPAKWLVSPGPHHLVCPYPLPGCLSQWAEVSTNTARLHSAGDHWQAALMHDSLFMHSVSWSAVQWTHYIDNTLVMICLKLLTIELFIQQLAPAHPKEIIELTQITKFMGPTWGPPGSCRPQMGPMLAPWTLLSG